MAQDGIRGRTNESKMKRPMTKKRIPRWKGKVQGKEEGMVEIGQKDYDY